MHKRPHDPLRTTLRSVVANFASAKHQLEALALLRLAQCANRGTPCRHKREWTLDEKVMGVSAGRSSRKALRGFVAPVKIDSNRERVFLHAAAAGRYDDRKRAEAKREKKNAQARARRAAKREAALVAA